MNKIILTDVDGVLTNWSDSFCEWMEQEGYTAQGVGETYSLCEWFGIEHDEKMRKVREFNDSSRIENLPPHLDAVKYVRKIHNEYGYKFFVISSMSENLLARERRIKNLKQTFGDVFCGFIFLDTGADKDEVLEQFRDAGYFWIEDKPENAKAGLDVGLRSIIMEHGFNVDSDIAPVVKNWKQFYDDYIVQEQDHDEVLCKTHVSQA